MSGTGLPTSQQPGQWDDPWRRWESSAHEVPRSWSKAAVTSLVFGLIGGFVFGLVFGAVGLAATGRGGERRGRGLAWAGIALSLVWVVAAAGFLGWRVSHRADRGLDGAVQQAGTSSVLDLQTGDCLQDPGTGGRITDVDVLTCTEPHDAQVFAVVQPAQGDYDPARIQAEVEQLCTTAASGAVTVADRFDLLYFFPQEDGWRAGHHNSVCMLTSPTPLTTSVVAG